MQRSVWLALAGVAALALSVSPTWAEGEGATPGEDQRLDTLEDQMKAVIEEVDDLRKEVVVPKSGTLKSAYGLGPAASKVYFRDRGLSIGGYGELLFNAQVADKVSQNIFDALRGVLYVGYKFNDWLVFNSEFEFEHAGTSGGGSASIEFMNVDFLLDDAANLRVGLVLIPVGFINELHEPTTFFGATRPLPEQLLIPTTWRENGAGFFGEVGDWFSYRMYAVNGLDATGFSNNGIRGGRQKGSRALADNWAFVFRSDFTPCAGVLFGASVYTGKSGQNIMGFDPDGPGGLDPFDVPDTLTTLWEVHGEYKRYGVSVRALWVQVHLDDAAALGTGLGDTIAERMVGGYAELAYDLLPLILPDTKMAFEPFYRFEHVDTQDKMPAGVTPEPGRERNIHIVGVSYFPHPQVVVKLDYRNAQATDGTPIPDTVQVGLGFVF